MYAGKRRKMNYFILYFITLIPFQGTHFVRCVKPNSEMRPASWNSAVILSQLKCAGMGSVLRLMQKGFPSRTPFNELYTMYQRCLPDRLARLDPRMFCRVGLKLLGRFELISSTILHIFGRKLESDFRNRFAYSVSNIILFLIAVSFSCVGFKRRGLPVWTDEGVLRAR